MNPPSDDRIWNGLRRHFDELGSLSAPPPLERIKLHRAEREPRGLRLASATLGLGVLAVVGGLLISGHILPIKTPSAANSPGAAVVTDGPFELTLRFDKTTFRSSEDIDGSAQLGITNGQVTSIAASGGGPIAFSVSEVGGSRHVDGVLSADCAPYSLGPGAPFTTPIIKTGAYGSGDSNAAFAKWYLEGAGIHLPPGTWEIKAVATFAAPQCGDSEHDLVATVRVTVTN